jgi:hypothetical protein
MAEFEPSGFSLVLPFLRSMSLEDTSGCSGDNLAQPDFAHSEHTATSFVVPHDLYSFG